MHDSEQDALAKARSRSAGWFPSLIGILGLVALGLILIWFSSEGSEEQDPSSVAACRATLAGRECPVFALAWSPDGRKLAISGFSPIIKIWDRETGSVRSIEGETNRPRFVLGWTDEGRKLVVGGLEAPVEIWELGDSTPRKTRQVRLESVRDEVVRVIMEASGGNPIRVRGPIERRSEWLPASEQTAISAAFAPDRRSIATAAVDLKIRIWEASTGRLKQTLLGESRGFSCVAFSPDSSMIAAGGGGPLKIWETGSGAPKFTLGEGFCGSAVIGFSPEGARIAAAGWDGTIRVWNLSSGAEVAKFAGHDCQVLSLAWSPDGATLASGGYDSTIRLWDVAIPVQVALGREPGHVSPDRP